MLFLKPCNSFQLTNFFRTLSFPPLPSFPEAPWNMHDIPSVRKKMTNASSEQ